MHGQKHYFEVLTIMFGKFVQPSYNVMREMFELIVIHTWPLCELTSFPSSLILIPIFVIRRHSKENKSQYVLKSQWISKLRCAECCNGTFQ
jgi:hypothetical protein